MALWAHETHEDDRWTCPPSDVTFGPHQVLPGACQVVKGEGMIVNEADYISVIVWTVNVIVVVLLRPHWK